MTSKIYKSAQGKTVDLGTIMLKNEHVRAVGNMNVNARGDLLDSGNQVIETKTRQIQKQNNRTTVATASNTEVHTSTAKAKRARAEEVRDNDLAQENTQLVSTVEMVDTIKIDQEINDVPTTGGGLAAAIARSKIVKQEKEKSLREIAKESNPGVRRI